MVRSIIADLLFLSRARAFVGTARSFVGVSALLLMGALPPAVSLEGYPIQTMLHIRGRYWEGEARTGPFKFSTNQEADILALAAVTDRGPDFRPFPRDQVWNALRLVLRNRKMKTREKAACLVG
jgi:hypothetical protein